MTDPEPATVAPAIPRAGFRLQRLEVLNWGTFDEKVWSLNLRGDNGLLTGDIGSGKSSLVDALTTLLVPPQKVAYNKAAGAERGERSLRTYVLGYYKHERGDAGASRPVRLRDENDYSVLLARFLNEDLQLEVTLAQVFWHKELEGQPARFFVVADGPLTIAEHFSHFGSDLAQLRKRLRALETVELHETFPPYGAAFRRRFGIQHEQALDLFQQTVSMKSVGDLTEFVRAHMLEAFEVQERIVELIRHFDDLTRAHEAVLKAKAQIERLTPLVADCDRHGAFTVDVQRFRTARDALRPWFANLKRELLLKRLASLAGDLHRHAERITACEEKQRTLNGRRDELKQAIAENGGDRIERIKKQLVELEEERKTRRERAHKYRDVARKLGLPDPGDAETFQANQQAMAGIRDACVQRLSDAQNEYAELDFSFRQLRKQREELADELESLRRRQSNIPLKKLSLRTNLCQALGLAEEDIPFAGELIQVREDERDWEGAIERLLHGFGVSLLVADEQYAQVAHWVDRTHLGDHLVYFRVPPKSRFQSTSKDPGALHRKLQIKDDSPFYVWLEGTLARRFDHICCETQEQFRREPQAITKSGQIKGGEYHEKDDRYRIDDRSRYVLGWTNEQKIAALQAELEGLDLRLQSLAVRLAKLSEEKEELGRRRELLSALAVFGSFREIDWRSVAAEIEALDRQRRELEEASDVLRKLQEQLRATDEELARVGQELDKEKTARDQLGERQRLANDQVRACDDDLARLPESDRAEIFPRLEELRASALGERVLTVESCDNREKDMRDWMQGRIDELDKRLARLSEAIVKAMQDYRREYPLETQEADASVDAAAEYRTMLERLQADDLPRFEAQFKELLNENTIREVASFQSQLRRERQTIQERVALINESLREINYNPGRYIVLEAEPAADPEIKEFQHDLRACTEGTLTGSEDVAYPEAKFLQVRRIIERFRGRDGSAEEDRRWTRKVTDVRTWFSFSASERWREDDREHEHYTDSSGKSGGQKEKLAYTILAASLAYQFGLEWGTTRTRTFRFVVIDEAFGRGSDESARFGLELFRKLNLQLLIVTPLQKIHIIEPYVAGVGFVHSVEGRQSMIRNLTIEEYRAERLARTA